MLWRSDFQNARLMLQALQRRIEAKPPKAAARAAAKIAASTPEEVFHLHRQAQSQRSRTLSALVIQVEGDYSIPLRRAPDWKEALTEAWGPATGEAQVVSLRELLGVVGAHEWRKKGVEIAALGDAPRNRIHPHYGVFSPVRGEYIDLVAKTPLPSQELAFDIGTGTGVLAAVLARRGVRRVVATENAPRALACARDNLQRLGLAQQVTLQDVDLFPEGQAPLIVCNPPWVPARPSSPIEHAVYDEGSRMLQAFLAGLASHLAPGGEGRASGPAHPRAVARVDRCRQPARAGAPRCAPSACQGHRIGRRLAGCACGRSHVAVAAGCGLRSAGRRPGEEGAASWGSNCTMRSRMAVASSAPAM